MNHCVIFGMFICPIPTTALLLGKFTDAATAAASSCGPTDPAVAILWISLVVLGFCTAFPTMFVGFEGSFCRA